MDLLPTFSGRGGGGTACPVSNRSPVFRRECSCLDWSRRKGTGWIHAAVTGRRARRRRRCNRTLAAHTEPLLAYPDKSYSAETNAHYWSLRPVEVLKRSLQIAWGFGGWLADTKLRNGQDLTRIGGQQAERLRQLLTDLGPAFVKIGQAVSSRPDVTPPSYTKELEKLQDQIPPFNDEMAMRVIAEDLGRPASSLFTEMSASPIAAASLGQVYRARLRNGEHKGKEVAVKVQRPGIRESMALDIFILRWAVSKVRQLRKVNSDLAGLLDEWATSLFRELDYQREARNGARFRELYGDMPGVYTPHMYQDFTTERVLVMEWVQGTRLRSAGRLTEVNDATQDVSMVDIGVQCSLEQMLEVGFYHSDPHPGNLMRTPTGKLAYIDFGMMGEINPDIRRGLIQATLHLVNREFMELADDFVTLGLLPPESDPDQIVPALTDVFAEAVAGGVSNISFGELSGNLGRTMYQYSFRIPPFYTLLVRSLTVLEGIALSSDPDYKVLAAAYPWIARRLITNTAPELRETLRNLLYKGGSFQFQRLESLLRQAALSPNRSKKGSQQQPAATKELVIENVNEGEVTVSGLVMGTTMRGFEAATCVKALICQGQALQLLLSREGEFVYEILVEELAKGLDAGWRLATDAFIADAQQRALSFLGVGDGAGSSSLLPQGPALRLLRPLLDARSLATQDDRAQVEGLARLAGALQALSAQRKSNEQQEAAGGQTAAAARAQAEAEGAPAERAAAILRWLAAEAGSLPPEQRAQALRTPLLLLAKLSERITARALRAALSPSSEAQQSPALPTRNSSRGVGRFSSASGGAPIRSVPLSMGNGVTTAVQTRSQQLQLADGSREQKVQALPAARTPP